MRITIAILLTVILAFQLKAQVLTRKTFAKTEWFSDNADSLFYKSDTIRLIKYTNLISKEFGYNQYSESENVYLKNRVYVHLNFYKNGMMDFWNIKYDWSTKSKKGERTWRINKKGNELIISRNNLIEYKLKLITARELEILSGYEYRKCPHKPIELTLLKIK
jgi:hypothetical protein